MYTEFAAVLVFMLLGCLFIVGNLIIGRIVRPQRPGGDKQTIYECGEPTVGSSWIRFNSRFYNIALVYLLFDVEVVVLVPAMLVIRQLRESGLAAAAVVALMVFIGLLGLGLAYEWRWGNLDWIDQVNDQTDPQAASPNQAKQTSGREVASNG